MSETTDQRVFDTVSVIMGALVLFAVIIGVVAYMISNRTVEVSKLDDPVVRADLVQRLAPVGDVLIEGEEAVAAPVAATPPPVAAAPEPVAAARSGEVVYNTACVACHAAGIAGAPKVGDAELWAPRVAKGLDVLLANAINGFTGDTGFMPPKGGNMSLSDEEIAASIDYMLEQSQ